MDDPVRRKSSGHRWLGRVQRNASGDRLTCDPRPLHSARFYDLYSNKLGIGVYRSKGFIWFASRPDQVLLWNQAGGAMGIEFVAFWKVHMLEHDRRLLPEEKVPLRRLLEGRDPVFGDRSCELTVIGLEHDFRIWREGGMFVDPWPKKLTKL